MEDARFDNIARRLAGGTSRRGLLRGLAGLAGAGVLARFGRESANAADCLSRCDRLPAGASRDQCTAACAASDETRARADALRACSGDATRLCGSSSAITCCAADEMCQGGACIPIPVDCEPVGGACSGAGECCAPNVCADGNCVAQCPPGYRLCSGVCYAGGCCADVDCGGNCQVCGTDHACHSCEELGLTCQNGSCSAPPPTCGPSNCEGCCSANGVCQTGMTGAACGAGGTACINCPNGERCCGGTCANLQNDPAHCGSCATACAPGQVCDQRVCCTPLICQPDQCGSPPDGCGGTLDCGGCSDSETCCGGACANLESDAAHCGTCGHACASGQDCCNGACTSVQSDPQHCGACSHACPSGQSCCNGACADLETDAANCGTCGDVCPSGEICCDGACTEPCFETHGCCPTGESCCGSICCANCCGGECCQSGQSCCGGSTCCDAGECCNGECCYGGACCAGGCCGPNTICCGDICTNLNDMENCGVCDNTCAPNQVCLGTGGCCTPGTCEGRCGAVSDGCESTLVCGDCPTGECLTCDSTGNCVTTCAQKQVCHQAACCTPKTCTSKDCGTISDGCGGTINCSCSDGQQCVNNGCFIAGNSDMCSESTVNACPCNSNQDCCTCDRGWDGTIDYLCVRSVPDPPQIDCPNGNADCPQGWVCMPAANPVENSFCAPPC